MTTVVADEGFLRRLVAEEVARAVQPVLDAIAQHNGTQAKQRDNTLMTRQEVVDLLRIDTRTLRRLEREGSIPSAIVIGERTLRWRRREIEKLLDDQGKTLMNGRS